MPIIFADNHRCEKCGKLFEWHYFKLIRHYISSPQFEVVDIPQVKTLVSSCQQSDPGVYEIRVNCPYCDFDNHFDFVVSQNVK